jgi:hypothetical protein
MCSRIEAPKARNVFANRSAEARNVFANRSAEGAKYDSQGQAQSASPLEQIIKIYTSSERA